MVLTVAKCKIKKHNTLGKNREKYRFIYIYVHLDMEMDM